MSNASDMEITLRAALPDQYHGSIPALAQILAAIANGILSQTEARERIEQLPHAAAMLQQLESLDGRSPAALFSFGLGNTMDRVDIDTVAGRDVIQINLNQPSVAPQLERQAHRLARYLAALQSQILGGFRQDTYVMLTVESREYDDPHTIAALEQAFQQALGIRVREGMQGGGSQEALGDAIADKRLVALLGDPGAGKTTSMRYVTLQQIKAARIDALALLPVWVSLSKWTDAGLSAEEYIWQEFCAADDLPMLTRQTFHDLLWQGGLLVLFDGLNELPQRKLISRSEQDDKESNPSSDNLAGSKTLDARENSLLVLARESASRFIISCRISEYTHLPGWHELRILPLDDEQISEFIQRQLGDERATLERILEAQPQLRDLMRNPYLLRSLVFLARIKWEEAPTDRFELVQQVCLAALHREAPRYSLDVKTVVANRGEDAFQAMQEGYIGSWFLTTPTSAEAEEADETSETARFDDIAYLRCLEGAGLMLRVERERKGIAYRYQHQLVQEALALLYLQTEHVKEDGHAGVQSLMQVGDAHRRWGKAKEAQENYARALELCPAVGTESLRSRLHLQLANLLRALRRSREGLKHAELALQLAPTTDASERAGIHTSLANIHEQLRNTREAEYHYRQARDISRGLDDQSAYASTLLYGLGDFYINPKVYRPREAIALFAEAKAIFDTLDDAYSSTMAKRHTAYAWWLLGDLEQAMALYQACTQAFGEQGKFSEQIAALIWQGHIHQKLRQFNEAERTYRHAMELALARRIPVQQYRALVWGWGYMHRKQRNYERAREYYQEGISLAKRFARLVFELDAHFELGLSRLEAKHYLEAIQRWQYVGQTMDEEYSIQLDPLRRLAVWWSQTVGRSVERSWTVRLMTGLARVLWIWLDDASTPDNWFGRQLWHLCWWIQRF